MNKNILLLISLLLSANYFINSTEFGPDDDGGFPERKSFEPAEVIPYDGGVPESESFEANAGQEYPHIDIPSSIPFLVPLLLSSFFHTFAKDRFIKRPINNHNESFLPYYLDINLHEPESQSILQKLPSDCIASIFDFLPTADLVAAQQTCETNLVTGDTTFCLRYKEFSQEKKDQKLIKMIEIGSLKQVKLLIDSGANVNYPDRHHNRHSETALMQASICGRMDVVKLLLDRGANIETQDNNGTTSLIYASIYGRMDVIELLLDRGANIEAQNNDGITALIEASAYSKKVSAYSIEAYPYIREASACNRIDVIELLLDRGANIEAQARNGMTAFIYASAMNNAEIAQLLLDRGANIEAQALNGKTALMYAFKYGHYKIAQLLLYRGANIEARDNHGRTALIEASSHGRIVFSYITREAYVYCIVVQLLLNRGANIEAQAHNGKTALIEASANGYIDVVQLLIDRGSNIEAQGHDGRTALIEASAYGRMDVVQLLIDRGANIEAQDNNGRTASMIEGYEIPQIVIDAT